MQLSLRAMLPLLLLLSVSSRAADKDLTLSGDAQRLANCVRCRERLLWGGRFRRARKLVRLPR